MPINSQPQFQQIIQVIFHSRASFNLLSSLYYLFSSYGRTGHKFKKHFTAVDIGLCKVRESSRRVWSSSTITTLVSIPSSSLRTGRYRFHAGGWCLCQFCVHCFLLAPTDDEAQRYYLCRLPEKWRWTDRYLVGTVARCQDIMIVIAQITIEGL